MKPTLAWIFLCFLLVLPIIAAAQPEVFHLDDFELRGPVESCTVITDYGEERFEFDREGKLTKSLTRYSDSDYDITYYRYRAGILVEKRDEVYRDGIFDERTSFARFYSRDSLQGKRVIEKITSYDQQILEQVTYRYDTLGRLQDISRVHPDGIDETDVIHTIYKDEHTSEYYLNEQLVKSVRTSSKSSKDGPREIQLVKEYYQDAPQGAVEQVTDTTGRLLSEVTFRYNTEDQAFRKAESHTYAYNTEGFLSGEKVNYYKVSDSKSKIYRTEEKSFVYQHDGKTPGNWIRKIVTPENSFIRRRITYFQEETSTQTDSVPEKG